MKVIDTPERRRRLPAFSAEADRRHRYSDLRQAQGEPYQARSPAVFNNRRTEDLGYGERHAAGSSGSLRKAVAPQRNPTISPVWPVLKFGTCACIRSGLVPPGVTSASCWSPAGQGGLRRQQEEKARAIDALDLTWGEGIALGARDGHQQNDFLAGLPAGEEGDGVSEGAGSIACDGKSGTIEYRP
jgi:hypothetical protein